MELLSCGVISIGITLGITINNKVDEIKDRFFTCATAAHRDSGRSPPGQ
jgi:hypothetical protein